jgi:hypothetical protein
LASIWAQGQWGRKQPRRVWYATAFLALSALGVTNTSTMPWLIFSISCFQETLRCCRPASCLYIDAQSANITTLHVSGSTSSVAPEAKTNAISGPAIFRISSFKTRKYQMHIIKQPAASSAPRGQRKSVWPSCHGQVPTQQNAFMRPNVARICVPCP